MGSIHAMIDYLAVVSTTDGTKAPSSSRIPINKGDSSTVKIALQQRLDTIPALHREATPSLPYLLDVPKHLAIVTSLAVRYCRSHPDFLAVFDADLSPLGGKPLRDLCVQCMNIEDTALHRIGKLAAKPRYHGMNQKRVSDPAVSVMITEANQEFPVFSSRERKVSLPQLPSRVKRLGRPSTAVIPPITLEIPSSSGQKSMPPSPAVHRQDTRRAAIFVRRNASPTKPCSLVSATGPNVRSRRPEPVRIGISLRHSRRRAKIRSLTFLRTIAL